MTEATPSEGALSIEQAMGLLSDAPAGTVEPEETEIEPSTPEGDAVSEAQEPGDDGEAETQEPEAEEAPVVDAPHWWTAEDKAHFAKLTPEAQAIVARQEAIRESVTSKAKEEAAAERKRAEAEVKAYSETMQALGQWLPQAVETFKSRWDGVNWAELQRDYSAEEVNEWRFQYEAEQQQITAAQQAAQQATAQERQRFLADEGEKLAKLVPALVDPEKGANRRNELLSYIVSQGIAPEQTRDLPAAAIHLAWKAQQYDNAQASLAAKTKPIPQRANVQPTAAPQRTSQTRSVEQISARLSKSGSIDDAVALLLTRRK